MSASIGVYTLLLYNVFILLGHIIVNYYGFGYFCQLTVLAQILVIINFCLSISLRQQGSNLHTGLMLSRFHLVTLSLQAVVVLGFWGLRIFFAKGIIRQGQQYDLLSEFLSVNIHGGTFLTMFYFIANDRIVTQTMKRKKYIFHLMWSIPYILIQYLHWSLTNTHVYPFIQQFNWPQLIIFEITLYLFAAAIDYSFSVRHAYKLIKSKQQYQNKRKDQ